MPPRRVGWRVVLTRFVPQWANRLDKGPVTWTTMYRSLVIYSYQQDGLYICGYWIHVFLIQRVLCLRCSPGDLEFPKSLRKLNRDPEAFLDLVQHNVMRQVFVNSPPAAPGSDNRSPSISKHEGYPGPAQLAHVLYQSPSEAGCGRQVWDPTLAPAAFSLSQTCFATLPIAL